MPRLLVFVLLGRKREAQKEEEDHPRHHGRSAPHEVHEHVEDVAPLRVDALQRRPQEPRGDRGRAGNPREDPPPGMFDSRNSIRCGGECLIGK